MSSRCLKFRMCFAGVVHQPGTEELGRTKGTPGLVDAPAGWWKWPERRWRYRWRWRRRRRGRVCVRQASHVQRTNGLAMVRSTTTTSTTIVWRPTRARRRAVTAPPGSGRVGWPSSGKPSGCLSGHGYHGVTHRRVQG